MCAVCSPHTAPLRVFTQTTPKRLRICTTCFHEMGGASNNSNSTKSGSKQNQLRRSVTSASSSHTDEDSLLGGGAAYPYSDDQVGDLEDLTNTNTSTNMSTASKHAASLTSVTIHCGPLEFFHGSGFRKSWHEYFFVLLIRKGSLGMFLQAQDHLEKKRPAAVFKLSGYAIRVKSQKRRPHQFRVSHPTKKILHFAATSIETMNAWISQFIKAIDIANELEALSPIHMSRPPRRGSFTSANSSYSGSSGSPRSVSPPENDFAEEGGDGDEGENAEDIDIEALAAGGGRRGGLDEADEDAAEDDD